MPRKKLIRCSNTSYYVTIKSTTSWFYQPLRRVWKIACESLAKAEDKYPVNVHAFVLMSNHYHLVLDTPDSNLDKFMYEFNKNFSLALRQYSKNGESTFTSRYKWCLVDDDHIPIVLSYIYPPFEYQYQLNRNKAVRNEICLLADEMKIKVGISLRKHRFKLNT
ncbi:transposase [Bacteriovorax sp. Seq25_V]|uniref:transposase n=1 Tax=Bacteriovorax sp. Seq25_V TaxID=1201288 RepID=UPI00038A106F|nr:transposase [Bacteriovorax sp. Seq25_V]EQC43302.1 transposase IS200-like protein [Bacteriovorax sp. Seq25_V]